MNKDLHIGYHTCKLKNGYKFINQNIPFLSGDGPNQWLTQGYYFWTDSDYWAKKWGKEGQRVIGKFSFNLCFNNEVLDLVGNVSHQEELLAFSKEILNGIKDCDKKEITINQIIGKLRTLDEVFPYLAVKAQDERASQKINFVEQSINKLKMGLITPQQICIFDKARSRIQLIGFIEPTAFSEKMPIS